MLRRFTSLLVVGAIAALGLVAQAVPASSGAGTGPTGYTYASRFTGIFTTCEFLAIDLSTGVAEELSSEGTLPCADGLTFGPDGTLYGYRAAIPNGAGADAALVTIDPATGAQTEVGPLPRIFFGNGGMTFDAAGDLWLYSATTDEECEANAPPWCLWKVNPADASVELIGGINEQEGVLGLAATCESGVQAITAALDFGLESDTALESVDTATAAVSEIVPLPDVFLPSGLDYDDAGGLWALGHAPDGGSGGRVTVYSIDPATGASLATNVTVEGEPFFAFAAGLAISPISCPVPPPTPAPEVVLAPTFTG